MRLKKELLYGTFRKREVSAYERPLVGRGRHSFYFNVVLDSYMLHSC